ncbi:MAG TPA: OmpA family protein, partial [Myxococcota bacterium]|nr:OmpA family protein [Myxococcota bacterium]
LAALGILGIRRRRSRALLVGGGLLMAAPAHAYDLGLDVQRFHSAYDPDLTFSRNDPSSHKGLGAGLVFSYANNPLVYRYDDTEAGEVAVISDLLAADLYGSWGFGRVRAGLGLPMYLYGGGEVVPGTTRLGDMHADVQGVILDRRKSGLGVGVNLNLTLPTGMEAAGLGEPVPTVAVDMSVAYGKRWLVQADLGFGTGGGTSLPPDLKWGPSFRWGIAGSLPVGEQLRAVGELDGEVVLPASGGASTPMEWRIGAIYAPIKPLAVQLAVGTGLGRGIGAPDVRAIAGVAWVPTRSGSRSAVVDRDGDGILVPLDLCPDQAEDVNKVEDKDGCPEGGLTPTRLLVEDSNGALVAGATVRLLEGPETGAWTLAEGGMSRSLPPGEYRVRVEARGFAAVEQGMTVPTSESFELRLKVVAQEGAGPVDIWVTDLEGSPLVATVRVMGSDRSFSTNAEGKATTELPFGVNDLWISADGYRPVPYRVEVASGVAASVVAKLPVSSVKMVGNEVQISQKIFFALGSDEIEAVSRVTLDDVAALLLSTPSITRIEIQGHTDDQGAASQNLELSQRRAEAVANYLIEQHAVNPNRLVARGYGESQPLVPDTTEDARDANRRVVFRVLERDGQPVPDWDSGHRPPRRPKG